AIDYLAEHENSVLILGDMGELGEASEQAHSDVGTYAAQQNIGALLAVGRYSELAVKSFGKYGEWYPSQKELIEALRKRDLQDNSILVKGSRGSKMENVVQAILTFGEKHNAGLAG
nr:UDP-N-acetylmuramoyl-tripeptide--D-alanyl-D-alanine ligase [Cellvibrionaceae bacterium]